jgi:hypothetical protein
MRITHEARLLWRCGISSSIACHGTQVICETADAVDAKYTTIESTCSVVDTLHLQTLKETYVYVCSMCSLFIPLLPQVGQVSQCEMHGDGGRVQSTVDAAHRGALVWSS